MDIFKGAKAVRLRSHHGKYLLAADDDHHVRQDRNGADPSARWTVELTTTPTTLRLRSCQGLYLTASDDHFLLGLTGRKAIQAQPPGPATEWQPIRDGSRVKLKTASGRFLRANGGLPPWRDSVTHDVPHRTVTQEWVLWDVDVVDLRTNVGPSAAASRREVWYWVADGDGWVEDGAEGRCLVFDGRSVAELTERLEEETGLTDVVVCERDLVDGELRRLTSLDLPAGEAAMRVVVVGSDSG